MIGDGLVACEREAISLVMTGNVLVNDHPASSIHEKITPDSTIRIRTSKGNFVTRAGDKLAWGLSSFAVTVAGKVCLDIGCAEGGFTDCLLQNGAAKVYAVDVARGTFAWQLRNDERVTLLEKTNARYLNRQLIPEPIDFFCCDVSFISLQKILPVAAKLLTPTGSFIVLYKPQFELPRSQIGKNGIPHDPDDIKTGIAALTAFAAAHNIFIRQSTASPLQGSKGNVEYLLYGDCGGG